MGVDPAVDDLFFKLRMRSFLFKTTVLIQAGEKGSCFFGRLFNHKFSMAPGAFFCYGFVPDGILAIRIATATIENFAPFGLSFHQVSAAVFFRA